MKVKLDTFLIPYHTDGSLYSSAPHSVKEGQTTYQAWEYDVTPVRPGHCVVKPQEVTKQADVIWLKNDPFTLELTIMSEKDHRRLKAKTVWWVADDGRKFPMFANNLASTLLGTTVIKGRTDPIEWVVRKHGREFGILPHDRN